MPDQLGLSGNLDVSSDLGGKVAALGLKARYDKPHGLERKKQPPKDDRATVEDELAHMFTPIERGGRLRTSASPARMVDLGNGQLVAAPLPPGHSWGSLPKAVREKYDLKLPPGVIPIGIEPVGLSEMQQNMMTWFGQQADLERQTAQDAVKP